MGLFQSSLRRADLVTEVANNMNNGKVAPEEVQIVIDNPEEDQVENPEEEDQVKCQGEMKEPNSYEDWVFVDIGYGIDSRREVHDMYTTVKRLELEDWIKNTDWCNMRGSSQEHKISDGLENNNHSGASFGGCLWKVKEVFKKGWYPEYSKQANCKAT